MSQASSYPHVVHLWSLQMMDSPTRTTDSEQKLKLTPSLRHKNQKRNEKNNYARVSFRHFKISNLKDISIILFLAKRLFNRKIGSQKKSLQLVLVSQIKRLNIELEAHPWCFGHLFYQCSHQDYL